jgi:hypothetical protein
MLWVLAMHLVPVPPIVAKMALVPDFGPQNPRCQKGKRILNETHASNQDHDIRDLKPETVKFEVFSNDHFFFFFRTNDSKANEKFVSGQGGGVCFRASTSPLVQLALKRRFVLRLPIGAPWIEFLWKEALCPFFEQNWKIVSGDRAVKLKQLHEHLGERKGGHGHVFFDLKKRSITQTNYEEARNLLSHISVHDS